MSEEKTNEVMVGRIVFNGQTYTKDGEITKIQHMWNPLSIDEKIKTLEAQNLRLNRALKHADKLLVHAVKSHDDMYADYKAIRAECAKLKSQNLRYREALENIARHQEVVSGEMAKLSTTWVIAKEALKEVGE